MKKTIQEIRAIRSIEVEKFIEINELKDFNGFIIWLSNRYEKGDSSYDIAKVLTRNGVNFSARTIQRLIKKIGISRDKKMASDCYFKKKRS